MELTSLSAMDLLNLEAELQRLPDYSNGWNPLEVQLVLQVLQLFCRTRTEDELDEPFVV